jgi:carboxyl-terminal processing protease
MKTFLKLLFVVAIATIIMGSSFAAGYGTRWYFYRDTPMPDEAQGFSVFWEAWHILESNFYGDLPSPHAMAYGAIRGVLSLVNDPHTVLVEPEPRRLEKDNLKGSFGGIGAYIGKTEDGKITIKVMDDSPAMRAGLQDDDIITKIDDTELTPEMSDQDVVLLIRGPIGEAVKLTIVRSDVPDPFDVEVVREKIETPTVEWKILDNKVGYISINLFGERTASELSKALQEAKDSKVESLVLDLRNNPGGLLNAAIDVAGQFTGRKVVLHERKRDGSEKTYESSEDVSAPDIPVVVLVNRNTASASEIVSGALRDVLAIPLVGEKTFGKGSVQMVYDLSDGSSLHVTIAHWFTPDHHQIQDEGLSPDYEVTQEEQDQNPEKDLQLEKALEVLKSEQSQ